MAFLKRFFSRLINVLRRGAWRTISRASSPRTSRSSTDPLAGRRTLTRSQRCGTSHGGYEKHNHENQPRKHEIAKKKDVCGEGFP